MSFRIFNNTDEISEKISYIVEDINIIQNYPQPEDIQLFSNLEKEINNIESLVPLIELSQADFSNGTYRIKTPGYYKLTENISFNPNPSTWDGSKLVGNDWMPTQSQTAGGAAALYPVAPHGPYHMGFFAAISVESNNVVIDLNEFKLSQSLEHYLQQRFFNVIELASSPFISSQGPSDFGDSVIFPQYIKVKNGNLGLSSHNCIHGNGMKNIILQDLNLFDYEQAGIGLNGGENMILKNICIGKNSRNVFVNAAYSQSRFVRSFLQQVIDSGDPSIVIKGESKTGTQLLSELVSEMDGVYKDVVIDSKVPDSTLYRNESLIIDGSVYGLLLNVLGVAVNGFMTSLTDTSGNKNILIQNLNVSNLVGKPEEIVGLSVENNDSIYGLPEQKGPVGDVFRITKMTDSNDYYIPNVLANAQCYIAKHKDTMISPGTTNIDAYIYDTWIASDTPLTPLIENNNDYFVCGGDSMAHIMKGNIGIFLSGAQDIKMYNINIKNIVNEGELGEVTKCPPGTPVYNGNRCRGIAVVVNKNLYIKDLTIDRVQTTTTDAMGIDFIGSTDQVEIEMYRIVRIDQASILDSGEYPNVKPQSHLLHNKYNVTNLKLT